MGNEQKPDEFELIARFFAPLAAGCSGAGLCGAACCGAVSASAAAASEGRSTMPSSSNRASTRREISFSAIRASISASGVGGSAPKYRSSDARSRKYSAIAFMVSKDSSNPSNVHENVP